MSYSNSSPLRKMTRGGKKVRFNDRVKIFVIRSNRMNTDETTEATSLHPIGLTSSRRLRRNRRSHKQRSPYAPLSSNQLFFPLSSTRRMPPEPLSIKWNGWDVPCDYSLGQARTPAVRMSTLDIIDQALQIAVE